MKALFRTKRKAIAMIELIFAIVIMGIVMLSAPLMVSTASQSSTVSFQQESIAMAASQANTLMTYAWDEKNTNSFKLDYGDLTDKVLTVSGTGDSELTVSIASVSRQHDANLSSLPGTFGSADPAGGAGALALTTELFKDDIDDFDGNETNLTIANGTTTGAVSYEDNYMDIVGIKLKTSVSYWDDAANYAACSSAAGCAFSNAFIPADDRVASTNIKRIIVELNSTNVPDKTIILKSFMCNIGSARPLLQGGF